MSPLTRLWVPATVGLSSGSTAGPQWCCLPRLDTKTALAPSAASPLSATTWRRRTQNWQSVASSSPRFRRKNRRHISDLQGHRREHVRVVVQVNRETKASSSENHGQRSLCGYVRNEKGWRTPDRRQPKNSSTARISRVTHMRCLVAVFLQSPELAIKEIAIPEAPKDFHSPLPASGLARVNPHYFSDPAFGFKCRALPTCRAELPKAPIVLS